MSINVCSMMGTLVKDPELKYTKTGTALAILRIATRRKLSQKITKEDITDYHDAKIWGESAELVVQTFKKGQRIFITGSIENNNYTDAQGSKHYGYVINVKSFDYIEKKEKQAGAGDEAAQAPDDKGYEKPEPAGEIIKF